MLLLPLPGRWASLERLVLVVVASSSLVNILEEVKAGGNNVNSITTPYKPGSSQNQNSNNNQNPIDNVPEPWRTIIIVGCAIVLGVLLIFIAYLLCGAVKRCCSSRLETQQVEVDPNKEQQQL